MVGDVARSRVLEIKLLHGPGFLTMKPVAGRIDGLHRVLALRFGEKTEDPSTDRTRDAAGKEGSTDYGAEVAHGRSSKKRVERIRWDALER